MDVYSRSVMLTWLLLTARSTLTSGQDDDVTDVITAEVNGMAPNQVTGSYALSTVLGPDATKSTMGEGNQTEETTRVQTTAAKMSSVKTETAAASTHTSASSMSTTEGLPIEDMTSGESTTMVGTTQASNPTEFTTAIPKLGSSTQRLDTGETSTGVSTRLSQPTTMASTAITSINPEEGKSFGTSPVTGSGGSLTKPTASEQTSATTTITPLTKPKKKTDPQGDKAKSNAGTNHSKVVAGIIGGALLLMMVGFVVIYFKKRKLQKKKITTTDWAGPSPFLESESSNGHAALRSSNRISLSSFLPQRLSKRLSLLPESDEEMQDMTPGSTFASKHMESTNVQKVDENGVQEKNGSVPDVKLTGDSNEVGEPSSQTNNSESTNNNSEVTNLNQNQSDNPSDVSEVGEKSNSTI